MNRDILINQEFKEKRVNDTYYYQLGYVCLRFCGLGNGRYFFDYLAGNLCIYTEIKNQSQLDTLINLLNNY